MEEALLEWQIMYWPDRSPQKRRKRSIWISIFVLGLAIGIVIGGSMNGWWGLMRPSANHEAEAAVNTKPTTVTTIKTDTTAPIPTISAQVQTSATLAPDFVLPALFDDSLEYRLADYDGRPVILNFWASWCVPCKVEMPALQRAYEKYRDERLVVLGVNQTFVDDLDAARDFVNELALTFPNASDETGITSEKLYQVVGLPTSLLISSEGEIVHVQIGQMTDEQVDTFSMRLVSGEAVIP